MNLSLYKNLLNFGLSLFQPNIQYSNLRRKMCEKHKRDGSELRLFGRRKVPELVAGLNYEGRQRLDFYLKLCPIFFSYAPKME